MSKHGQDYNETRSYGEGFEDGRRYERMESHRRASLLDPDEVYIKPNTTWHSTLVAGVLLVAGGFLIYAIMSVVSLFV